MLLKSLYWETECHRLQLTSLVLLEKTSQMDNVSFQQIINRIPLLKNRYRGSFPSEFVPTLDNDTFAIICQKCHYMPAICRVSIAQWSQNLVKFCILHTLLVVKKTVSSSNIMNRWCQNHCSPIPAFAVSTRYMQLFISSNSDKKKLEEFTMLMYFRS